MNTFVNAVKNQEARTTNGMKARKSTSNAVVDLFFKIGASRGKNIIPDFTAALVQDKNLALRIALWTRDVRGGAGERQLFREILVHLEKTDIDAAKALLARVPELGRWDDIFVFQTDEMKKAAYTMLGDALRAGNGLDIEATEKLAEALTIPVIASGGVTNLEDIKNLCSIAYSGVSGAITGIGKELAL